MKRIQIAVVILACCAAGGAWSQGKPPDKPASVSVVTTPDWLRKPSADDVRGAYPINAKASEGIGRIRCLVTVQGLLRDCRVISETPEGQGFGGAALAIVPQFLMRPATRDGVPFEAEVTIPIHFDCDVSCKEIGKGGRKILTGLNWTVAPTQAQMVGAYPPKAKAAHILGVASIECQLTGAGGLHNCQTMSEEPKGEGFGKAAISLGRYFQTPNNIAPDVKVDGAMTRLTFTFGEQMFDGAPYVARPKFAAAPTPREMMDAYRATAGEKEMATGAATVRCRIVEAGALTDCGLVNETPAGKGVGAAVLALAPKFRLATWTEDGLPVIGTSVRLPIKFDIKDPPKAEPAKSSPAP